MSARNLKLHQADNTKWIGAVDTHSQLSVELFVISQRSEENRASSSMYAKYAEKRNSIRLGGMKKRFLCTKEVWGRNRVYRLQKIISASHFFASFEFRPQWIGVLFPQPDSSKILKVQCQHWRVRMDVGSSVGQEWRRMEKILHASVRVTCRRFSILELCSNRYLCWVRKRGFPNEEWKSSQQWWHHHWAYQKCWARIVEGSRRQDYWYLTEKTTCSTRMESETVLLQKRDDKEDLKNYCSICLFSHTYKLHTTHYKSFSKSINRDSKRDFAGTIE